ncbi:MAG: PEP-CTERM sorting domain-containing protein, partial [Thermoguttaceae bacterium]|nr:PEP-CTERM sorting domain-containing protein [Thermoguttaceae bacterium]
VVNSGGTYTYTSSDTDSKVILKNSTLILSGAYPSNVEVQEGDNTISTTGSDAWLMNVTGDGNVTYTGGFLMPGTANSTGSTTLKNTILLFLKNAVIYDLTSDNDVNSNFHVNGIGTTSFMMPGDHSLTLYIRNGSVFSGEYEEGFLNALIDVDGILTICKAVDYQENAALKICCEAGDCVKAESVFLSSGRLDVQGLISSSLEIGKEGIFSPGNSPGTATVTKAVTLNGELLFEQDELGMDLLVADSIAVPGGEDSNPTIKFEFGAEVPEGATYEIIRTTQTLPWDSVESMLDENNPKRVNIEGLPSNAKLSIDGNSVKVTLARDPNAVPEPSTWALLVLGTAGLLYLRKREKK